MTIRPAECARAASTITSAGLPGTVRILVSMSAVRGIAGGGCNAGHTIGMTDDTGAKAVEGLAHVRDVHVTILKMLGLDDNKLTYFHGGRFKQLSQFGGTAVKGLIA